MSESHAQRRARERLRVEMPRSDWRALEAACARGEGLTLQIADGRERRVVWWERARRSVLVVWDPALRAICTVLHAPGDVRSRGGKQKPPRATQRAKQFDLDAPAVAFEPAAEALPCETCRNDALAAQLAAKLGRAA